MIHWGAGTTATSHHRQPWCPQHVRRHDDMTDTFYLYALLVLTGRFSLAEAQAGAAMHDPDRDVSSVQEAMRELVASIALATDTMRVNCPTCDGRGFYRGHKLTEHEAIVVFCDDCDGSGTIVASGFLTSD